MQATARGTRIALALGALLVGLGWWLPWISSRSGAAGLVLLGLDLGEFLKFTTSWRAGLIAVERNSFFLPPLVAALLMALALVGAAPRSRWLAALPLLWLCVVILPELEIVRSALLGLPAFLADAARLREFGGQFLMALIAVLVLVALLALGRRLPPLAPTLIALLLVLVGLLPLWALWRILPLVQGLYGNGATLGAGPFVYGAGLLAAFGACRELLFSGE